jgi:hypothetical protein
MATSKIPSSPTPRHRPAVVVATQRFFRRCWFGMLPVLFLGIWIMLRMIGVGNYTVHPDALLQTQEFREKVTNTSVSPPNESAIRDEVYSLYDGVSSRQRPMHKGDFLFSLAPTYKYDVAPPPPLSKIIPVETQEDLSVRAILYSKTDPQAIIGKQFVKKGDRIGPWTIERILVDRVILRNGQKQMTLKADLGSGGTR